MTEILFAKVGNMQSIERWGSGEYGRDCILIINYNTSILVFFFNFKQTAVWKSNVFCLSCQVLMKVFELDFIQNL